MKIIRLFTVLLAVFFAELNTVADNSFRLQMEAQSVTKTCNRNFMQSDTILLSSSATISGLAISGEVRKISPDYLVRVVLTDTEGNEYLVMEQYEEVCSDSVFSFSNYCEETALLCNVHPLKMSVILKDASLLLTGYSIANASRNTADTTVVKGRMATVRQCQTHEIINKINAYNQSHNRLWLAGETKLSQCSYAMKKKLLGLSEEGSTGGFEYYADGIFEVGHGPVVRSSSSPYVEEFDWRDRHGVNWMTSVKDQWWTMFCVGFAALGCVEALTNLYFNQKIDLNLSVQELASCADTIPHYIYGIGALDIDQVCNYLINHGVCDSLSFPFEHVHAPVPCKSDSITPNEIINISGTSSLGYHPTADKYKEMLISKGPLYVPLSLNGAEGHAMALVGYHTLKAGDSLYSTQDNLGNAYNVTISDNDSLIGATYWVFKDSYGDSEHYPHEGYRYILYRNGSGIPNTLDEPMAFLTPIIRMNHSDNEIVWEDKDDDGYFNWGIGSRSAICPSWVPSLPDGDDSDPTVGGMNSYGHCINLTEGVNDTTIIDDIVTYRPEELSENIKIVHWGELTIDHDLIGLGSYSITVDRGGILIIDGAAYRNAKIQLDPEATLIIRNAGIIYLRKGTDFAPPKGTIVSIEHGEINNKPY
jgi:hypothetical protein